MSNNSLKLRIYSHPVYGTQFIKPGQIPENRDVWSPYVKQTTTTAMFTFVVKKIIAVKNGVAV